MKKTIQKVLVCLLAFALTGCMKITVMLDVARDGTVKQSLKMLVPESLLTMDGSTPEEAIEEMKQSAAEENPDAVIEGVSEQVGEETYDGIQISGVSTELKAVKEGSTLTLTIPVHDLEDLSTAGQDELSGLSFDLMKTTGFSVTMIINMPAKAESNFGTVEENKVTVNLLEIPDDLENIVISCKVGNPLLIAGIIAVLAIIAAFFFLRKKKTPEPVLSETDQDPAQVQ